MADGVQFDLVSGFYNWEENGAFLWTDAKVVIETRSRLTRYLNVEIGARFAPVDEGPVRLQLNDEVWDIPWQPGGVKISIAVPGGRSSRIEISNPAGAKSPSEISESTDARSLALQLKHVSFDEAPKYSELE